MQKRIIHIFTFTLLATVFGHGVAYAQEEGGEQPIKAESTIIEKDSVQDDRNHAGEAKSDLLSPIVITPKEEPSNTSEVSLNPMNMPAVKKQVVNGDKVKEEEPQSSFRFNFIYYLFYKFKVGSSSSSGN